MDKEAVLVYREANNGSSIYVSVLLLYKFTLLEFTETLDNLFHSFLVLH